MLTKSWIPHFEPLTISVVKSVWVDMNNNQELNGDSLKQMQQSLFVLTDKDQLSFSEISGVGLPPCIYPMSGEQVFVRPDFDLHQQFRQSANKSFNEIGGFTGKVRGYIAKSIAKELIHQN